MIGLLLAGGSGSRMWPLTVTSSKQLLPVYDKPMIFYSLSTLMLAGIRDVFVVCNPQYEKSFQNILQDGDKFGINIRYLLQKEPKGIAQVFELVPKEFCQNDTFLVLGDNLFYGMGVGSSLNQVYKGSGALAFAYKVSNPSDYGVVQLGVNNEALRIVEKPKEFVSNMAIPGMYFFDRKVYDFQKNLKPSTRGELEITDLLNMYLEIKSLSISILERGTAWLDTGNPDSLLDAAEFVRVIEKRQGLKIGCPEEIALRQGFISKVELEKTIQAYPDGEYKKYLKNLLYE